MSSSRSGPACAQKSIGKRSWVRGKGKESANAQPQRAEQGWWPNGLDAAAMPGGGSAVRHGQAACAAAQVRAQLASLRSTAMMREHVNEILR